MRVFRSRLWNLAPLFAFLLLASECAVSAEPKKEVPYPELPKGAGKLDQDAPKTFTETKSGLKYEDLKEELVLADARIHELEQTLERAEIVAPPSSGDIGLGSTVTIRAEDGEEETWRLVSPEEADTREGTISTDSPVGSALMGRQAGDEATVTTPAGPIVFTILRVE